MSLFTLGIEEELRNFVEENAGTDGDEDEEEEE